MNAFGVEGHTDISKGSVKTGLGMVSAAGKDAKVAARLSPASTQARRKSLAAGAAKTNLRGRMARSTDSA
jgi:hypothetical protein